MASLKLASLDPYVAQTTFLDRERTRLYPIVVHGTTFGREPSSWSKRIATGEDYPFCAKLSEQLKMHGIPFHVWINCDELDMEEFKWSGLNEHHARLKGGRELARYINECHQKCAEKFREQSAFILIGHSHGGNVILASLGLLEPCVAIASIHLMGTPFLLYSDKPRLIRTMHDFRNIYLSAEVRCPIHLYTNEGGQDLDEVIGLFSVLQAKKYFLASARKVIKRFSERPQRFVYDNHPIFDVKLARVSPVTGTILDLAYAKFEGTYPSRWHRFKSDILYYWALVSWPFRWLAIRVAAQIMGQVFAKKLFHFATGLNPVFFNLKSTVVSAGLGFQPLFAYTCCSVPPPEAKQVDLDISIGDFLRTELSIAGFFETEPSVPSVSDFFLTEELEMRHFSQLDLDRVTTMSTRLHQYLGSINLISKQFKLMHTAYYRSDFVIREIAFNIKRYLPLTFPKLIKRERDSRFQ